MTPIEIETACRQLSYDKALDSYLCDKRLAFVLEDGEFEEYKTYLQRGLTFITTDVPPVLSMEVMGIWLVRRSKLSELPPPPPPRNWTSDDIRKEILALVKEGKIPGITHEVAK